MQQKILLAAIISPDRKNFCSITSYCGVVAFGTKTNGVLDMEIEKVFSLKRDMSNVLDKCCEIDGYAFRLGYIKKKDLDITQVIYKKIVHFFKGYYVEIRVKFGKTDNPDKLKCWTDITLFSPYGIQLAVSDPKSQFTGKHIVSHEQETYSLLLD
jgi:hypothetical protein